jgi:hypothetical protein
MELEENRIETEMSLFSAGILDSTKVYSAMSSLANGSHLSPETIKQAIDNACTDVTGRKVEYKKVFYRLRWAEFQAQEVANIALAKVTCT